MPDPVDILGEIERITLWVSILQIKETFKALGNVTYDSEINSTIAIVTSGKRLEGEEKDTVKTTLQSLKEKVPGLGITENEKVEIVKAMGLSKGHWYKCINGKFCEKYSLLQRFSNPNVIEVRLIFITY